MEDSKMLGEIVLLSGTAVAVAWLFRVIRLPGIIGFLMTGLAIGPSGWNLVEASGIGHYSELGLILLLFTIGLELSPEPLIRSGGRLFRATLLQVVAIAAPVALVVFQYGGLGLTASGLVGVAVALSSTAIVLKQLSDRAETTSTTGVITTGILLFQDIIVIALLLVLSLATPNSGQSGYALAAKSLGGLAGLVVVVVVANRSLPFVLTQVGRHGGRELNTLFAVLVAVGGAWAATLAGWSPALGACVAGFLLARADQRHQLVAEITPFRDVFNALFFISLGMSVNVGAVLGQLPMLAAAIVLTVLLKTVLTGAVVTATGWPVRIGVQVGVCLCTVSEFSYVLAYQASQAGWMPASSMNVLVAYAVGSMILGTLMFPVAIPLANAAGNLLGAGAPSSRKGESETEEYRDHVVVVGYGLTGRNLASMLRATHLPFCVVEMNQALAAQARRDGAPVVLGDATRMSILEHAGFDTARVLVVAVNDRNAARRIVSLCSARRPQLYILARTSFASDIDSLYERGARLVIPEDFETSIEVAAHVLKEFGVPDNIVEAQVAAVRVGGYGLLRGKPTDRASHAQLSKILERTTTQTFYLADEDHARGLTLAQTNLRALTGCMVIAIVRAGTPATNPAPDFLLQANDVLVLVGSHAQIEKAKQVLTQGPEL